MNVQDYIKQHTYKDYCEAIIYPNGNIEDAERGHVYKLMDFTGKSKAVLNKIIPNSASPIHYLVGYTGCISVWYNFFIFDSINDEQMNTLQELVDHGILVNGIPGNYTDELQRCNLLRQFEMGKITGDKLLKEREDKNFRVWRKENNE